MNHGNRDDYEEDFSSASEDSYMYEPRKAAQIIAYLGLKAQDRCIDMLKAIKLLYIAEREHLRRYAVPMLDEPRAALPNGPINSFTYDRVKGPALSERSGMTEALSKSGTTLKVAEGLDEWDLDELSDAEVETLDRVWAQFGSFGSWDLVKWTHDPANIPEWSDPAGSAKPIELEDIMSAVGVRNAEEQARVLKSQFAIERAISTRK